MSTQYMVERTLAGGYREPPGAMTPEDIKSFSQKHSEILPEIKWVQSYVLDEKIFEVYYATTEEQLREHARLTGFPIKDIWVIRSELSPVG